MRPYWFAPFLFISLGILLLVCFAVDGVVISLHPITAPDVVGV